MTTSQSSLSPALRFLDGGGEATALILRRDWSAHPLGPPEHWPDALKVAISIVLNSPESMILSWGRDDLFFFFNETYFPLLGPRLSWAMGARFDEVWADGLEQAMPIIHDAFAGRSTRYVDLPWRLATDRGAADTWWTFSYSRVLDPQGEIAGLFIVTNETTAHVLGQIESRAAENRNRQVLDSATEYAIIATDLDGRITRWNKGAERILGWREDEVLGDIVLATFTPEDLAAEAPRREVETALTTGRSTDERWCVRKDGARFWASSTMTPLRDMDNVVIGFVKVLRDRTGMQLAETRLRNTQDQLRRAQEAGGIGVFSVDNRGFVTGSPAFFRLYGVPEKEIEEATTFERLIVPEDEALVSTHARRISGQAATDVAYRIRRADTGEIRWISRKGEMERDADGQFIRFVGVARDITEQVETQQALAAEREQLTQIFEQAPSFMAMLRGPTHIIERVNPSFVRLTRRSDVTGKPAALTIPEASAQGFLILLDEVYRSGQPYVGEGVPYTVEATPDQPTEERFIDVVFQPIRDADGIISGIFIEGADVTERVRTRQAMAATEQQFQTFAQAMPNHVWTATPDGLLDWSNQRTRDYAGGTPSAFLGANWIAIIHPDDRDLAGERWAASLASGTTYEVEFRILRADGQYRWHLVRALPIRTDDGRILRWIGTSTDIEEQKVAEAETARDRDRLWTLSQDLMLVCDFDGTVRAVNPTAKRLLGWEEAEIVGANVASFIHSDDMSSTEDELAKLAHGVTTLAFENRYRTHDGTYRLIDWNAVPDDRRIHAVGRDVTQERMLARDQERIWTLSPVLKVVGTMDGQILSANPSWTHALGWTPEQTIGHNIMEFVAEEDRDTGAKGMARLASGIPVIEYENVFMTASGERRTIAWTTVPEGDTLYAFGRDITAEKAAAQSLLAAEEALRQSQKMEAVGQLTGGIAHDFNNLLQGITGSLEIIQRRTAQGRAADLDRFIGGAMTAANRAASLTHRLLAFSRRQPLDPRPVRVNPLIASMEDLLRRTMGERMTLDLQLADDLWLTLCDPNQLENAILNLAINARDAMPEGGTLTIATYNGQVEQDSIIPLRDVTPGDYICIAVTDTGSGMSAETVARAFEPFFTTKPIGQGTGLGLSMIYGFARQSEGHAKIESVLGEGTTFCLYLPRHCGETHMEEEDARVVTQAEQADAGEIVLVVEDEPIVRSLIVETLRELGYRAIEASDGTKGVEMLRSDARIDLLITDIGLPGLNGRQVADVGRSVRPDLKILFMTGYAETAAQASGFLKPGMALITKPFTMAAMATRIRAIIEG